MTATTDPPLRGEPMREIRKFEHQRNYEEDLSTEEKVEKLWKERELKLYMKARRMDLLWIWGKCLSYAAGAAALVQLIMGHWK